MEASKNKKGKNEKITLIILIMIFTLILSVGISYAWFLFTKSGQEQKIETGTFTISFNNDARIKMLGATPLTDEQAFNLAGEDEVSTYTLANTGNVAMQYRIILRPLNGFELQQTLELDTMPTLLDVKNLRYVVVEKDEKPTSGASNLVLAEKVYNGSEFVGYKLDSGVLDPNESNESTVKIAKDLRIWIKEDALYEEVTGKAYGFKIRVQALQYGHGIDWVDFVGE